MPAGLQLPPVRHDEERDLDAIQGHTFSGTTSHMLTFLGDQTQATAAAIGTACAMAPGDVWPRLVMLKSMRLVSGRQDNAKGKPRRVYVVTGEGRRKAGISDARSTTM